MGKTLKRFMLGVAIVLALGAVLLAVKLRPDTKWRVERDTIQAAAEAAERSGHPWAGVYLARLGYGVGDGLCLAPDGDYYGALYEYPRMERVGHGLGRVSVQQDRLSLAPNASAGQDILGRLRGSYRIVRWGDIRCLIRPDEAARFVHCMARGDECKDFRPLCTRGYVYGEPNLPEELARARREDPMHRPIRVRSVSSAKRVSYGWSWEVQLDAGTAEGLDSNSRLYWDGSREWVNAHLVQDHASSGSIGQTKEEGPKLIPPLKSGMKVARWKPVIWGRPDFIVPMADMRP